MFSPRDPDEYLLDTERRVVRVRRHWASLIWDSFEAAALLAVAVMISYVLPPTEWAVYVHNVLWYAALFVVLRFVYQIMLWWAENIIVTDKRFIMTRGIITTKVLMMPIGKVTDLTYKRSPAGRMFGYGTMILESAGQIQALNHIDYLPNPEEFYDAISELVFGDKKKQAESFSMTKAKRLAAGKKLVG
ncbi:PH domain-containing protein [Haloechinothrix sp. LS1_15]|uniref:PH domain-containing protein n=1 Tax=Haloechinothrix sp. LS1_15 TaxID=2652248 RepID=UPI002946F97D|nr:PH domain-containing protein [Haloechinothrix sp. LS1_15]MDV6013878.1 PH domain-containing protein [Haloechinothrix sp. LS1_15]